MCLSEAEKAGVRPKKEAKPKRDKEWMLKQLEGTGINMIGVYRGLVTRIEFEAGGEVFNESPAALVAYLNNR